MLPSSLLHSVVVLFGHQAVNLNASVGDLNGVVIGVTELNPGAYELPKFFLSQVDDIAGHRLYAQSICQDDSRCQVANI
jgi:hypothetical protein